MEPPLQWSLTLETHSGAIGGPRWSSTVGTPLEPPMELHTGKVTAELHTGIPYYGPTAHKGASHWRPTAHSVDHVGAVSPIVV